MTQINYWKEIANRLKFRLIPYIVLISIAIFHIPYVDSPWQELTVVIHLAFWIYELISWRAWLERQKTRKLRLKRLEYLLSHHGANIGTTQSDNFRKAMALEYFPPEVAEDIFQHIAFLSVQSQRKADFQPNLDCRFYAHNPYLLCAVNPTGSCHECQYFEKKAEDSL